MTKPIDLDALVTEHRRTCPCSPAIASSRSGAAMKAPDHTPYLADGDLRTPQDAYDWLCREIEHDLRVRGIEYHASEYTWRMRERLDRERRQACRRGALERWQRLSRLVRWARAGRSGWRWDEVGDALWWTLRQYLAFRAAARAR